jgi:hypothetical protein
LGEQILLVTATPARAAYSPCGNSNSQQSGEETSFQNTIFGGKAEILAIQPSICGSTATSTIWGGVAAHSALKTGSNYYGWAQAGYGQFGADVYRQHGYLEFSQYTKWCLVISPFTCASGYPVTDFHEAPPSTGPYISKSDYVGADNDIHLSYEGNVIAQTNFDPLSDWDSAWFAEFAGEVHQIQPDTPGYSTDHAQVTNLQKDTGGGTWADINSPSIVFPTNCRFHYAGQTGSDFDVWTHPPYDDNC